MEYEYCNEETQIGDNEMAIKTVVFKMVVEIDGVQHVIGETDFTESVLDGIAGGACEETVEDVCEWVSDNIDYNFSPM
jgi:hypothetical protein